MAKEITPEFIKEQIAQFWERFELPEFDYTIIQSSTELPQLYEAVEVDQTLAFDFESTGLDYMKDEPIGISIANADHSWYITEEPMRGMSDWLRHKVEGGVVRWGGHNVTFDMHFLRQLGIDPSLMELDDTQVMQWLINENVSLRLKDLARSQLGIMQKLASFKDILNLAKKILGSASQKEVSNRDIPIEIMGPYGALDGRLTYDLRVKLLPQLEEQGLMDLYVSMERPLLQAIYSMESNGLPVSADRAKELRTEFSAKMETISEFWDKETERLTGEFARKNAERQSRVNIPPHFLEKKKEGRRVVGYEWVGKPVNPNSPKQLSYLLFDVMHLNSNRKTKTAMKNNTATLSTDGLVLQRLRSQDKSGVIAALIDWRTYDKLVGTYLNTMIDGAIDGRIYTNFNRTGTVSGRFSSSGTMNLQNLPAHGVDQEKMREIIAVLFPSWQLLGSDYSQLELRILAHFCRDKALVGAFLWGADPHQMTADRLGIPRYGAKVINFGTIYGAGALTICDQIEKLGKPRPTKTQAQQWLDGFDKAYLAVPEWKKEAIIKAKIDGYVTTIAGRRRHVEPGTLDSFDNYTRTRAERQLINSIIQGSAADIINQAMIWINPALPDYAARLLLQVHDELLFQARPEVMPELSIFVQEKMEAVKDYFNISVPIVAQPAVGTTWAELKG